LQPVCKTLKMQKTFMISTKMAEMAVFFSYFPLSIF